MTTTTTTASPTLEVAELETERLSLSEVTPHPQNPRIHSLEQIKALRYSLSVDGYIAGSMGIQRSTKRLYKGHGVYEALLGIGCKFADFVVKDLTDAETLALLARDNALSDMSTNDPVKLKAISVELVEMNVPIQRMGYTLKEITSMQPRKEVVEDDPPEVSEQVVTKMGDLWHLGNHRLLAGDSTKAEDVERVMGGEKADMVFTDPPYGVNYEGGTFNPVQREKLSGDDWDIYADFIPLLSRFCDGPIYIWYADILADRIFTPLLANGIDIHSQIVWHKTNATYAAWNANYKQRHEVCLYCKPKGSTLRWAGPTDERTVWELPRDASNEYHPTQKPISLAVRAIANHKVSTVLDFFLGSGSTLIAADQLDRICYGLEIAPKYCDVIVKRYINHVGSDEHVSVERNGETLTWEQAERKSKLPKVV